MPTLDGWRAIAILGVFAAHLPTQTGHLSFLNKLSGWGDRSGVDLFFAISGILICSRLLEEEQKKGRIDLRGFYIRRIFRIQPAAYLYLVAIAVLAILRDVPMDWHAWRTSLFLFRNYVSASAGDTYWNAITGHFWSLAIEEHFYLVLPFLLVFFPRHRKIVLGALIVLVVAWVLWYVTTTPPALRETIWKRRTDFRILGLLFPAWLALFVADPPTRARMARMITPTRMLTLAACILLIAVPLKHHLRPHHAGPPTSSIFSLDSPVASDRNTTPQIVFGIPLLFPFIILSTLLHPEHLLSRALEWKALRMVGRISYSLYLWQQIFFLSFRYRDWPFARVPHLWVAVATLVCALISYFAVEKPMIRLGHRLAPPATPGHRNLDDVSHGNLDVVSQAT